MKIICKGRLHLKQRKQKANKNINLTKRIDYYYEFRIICPKHLSIRHCNKAYRELDKRDQRKYAYHRSPPLLQISNHLCNFARHGIGFNEITITGFEEFFSLCAIMLEICHKNNFCIF
jgi:hypothetical protein